MAKGKFDNFAASANPEYPLPAPETADDLPPSPIKRARSAPAVTRATARKQPFSSYMVPADLERFERLVEAVGKSRVRLLSEAVALLFKHYRF